MTEKKGNPFYFNELFDTGILANLSPAYALVYLAYVRYSNGGDGDARPSQATLARNLGMNERTVRRAVVRLKRLGYIKPVSSGKGKGSTKANVFTVMMPKQLDFPQKNATQAPVPPATDLESETEQDIIQASNQPNYKLTSRQLNNIQGIYWNFSNNHRAMLSKFPTEESLITYVESNVKSEEEFASLYREFQLDPTKVAV